MGHDEPLPPVSGSTEILPERHAAAWWTALVWMALMAVGVGVVWAAGAARDGTSEVHPVARQSGASTTRHPVRVRRPAPPMVEAGVNPVTGRAERIACATCHRTRQPDRSIRAGEDLEVFHAGLTFRHGTLACVSCHDPGAEEGLRLADGGAIAYGDVMTLCAQCHSAQATDYEHGAHGGMTGHWDLSRGPRERNNCIDCHDPHAPAFPMMQPTFKPRDRFLTPREEHHGG